MGANLAILVVFVVLVFVPIRYGYNGTLADAPSPGWCEDEVFSAEAPGEECDPER